MKDLITRAMTKDGLVNAVAISSTGIVERARQMHKMLPTATAALGRLLSAASMMGNMQKTEDGSITLQVKGGGPLGTLLAVSDAEGNVRGYVDNPQISLLEKHRGKLDVGAAVGNDGMLTVIRDLRMKEPYVGSVLFFKHVIFTVTLLLILIPTTLSIYLFAQVRSLNRQLDAAGSQLAAMQEQLPSTAPEGGEPTPVEPEPPAAEVPAYTELYPELYADDSLRGTVDVDNAVYLTFDDGPSARTDEILEILDKYGVKATFFVVGANE